MAVPCSRPASSHAVTRAVLAVGVQPPLMLLQPSLRALDPINLKVHREPSQALGIDRCRNLNAVPPLEDPLVVGDLPFQSLP